MSAQHTASGNSEQSSGHGSTSGGKPTLYHYWRSSCSWRVRWALALKGVAYDAIAVDILAGEHRGAAYKAINPSGFLPTLVIDGQGYGESLAILDYLEEQWPTPSLYPAGSLARLRARELALTIAAGTQPQQNPALLAHFVADPAARKPHLQHFISRGLGIYETLLGRAPAATFSCGEQPSIADLCLIPQVYNALRFDVDLTVVPRVKRIYEACLATPACEAAAPHRYEPKPG